MRAASIFRRARFVSQGLAFQNPRLLNHARKVRDRLFVDDRRLRLSRLPDDPREVSTGQDGQEAGCPYPIKAHPAPVGNHLIGWARNMAVPLLGGLQRLFDPINAGAGGTRKNPHAGLTGPAPRGCGRSHASQGPVLKAGTRRDNALNCRTGLASRTARTLGGERWQFAR